MPLLTRQELALKYPYPAAKAKKQHPPFTAWLQQQRDRNDPVGDLARDALFDADWPQGSGKPEVYRRYLLERGACDGAREALNTALAEWARLRA